MAFFFCWPKSIQAKKPKKIYGAYGKFMMKTGCFGVKGKVFWDEKEVYTNRFLSKLRETGIWVGQFVKVKFNERAFPVTASIWFLFIK